MNQRKVAPAPLISGTIRSRGPDPQAALAEADVQLPEPAQVPLHVGQIEVADLVDAQPTSAISR